MFNELSLVKFFRGARGFYRFLWGWGRPFDEEDNYGPNWEEMGSSLGVTQLEMPPNERGKFTLGWRTGLFDFDRGLEVSSARTLAARRTRRARRTQKLDFKTNVLDS